MATRRGVLGAGGVPGGPVASRRSVLRAAAVLASGPLVLAGCGQADQMREQRAGSGGGDRFRFSWWGADERSQRMQQIIDAYTADNPGVEIVPDFIDWGGYWDKLATVTAGGDTPDVFMQEDRYLREYADRGVLADLGALDVSTDDLDATLLRSGTFEGKTYGIPTGSNVMSVVASPAMFQAAGVEMPDDSTWTWEEYQDLARRITQGTPDGVYGTADYTYNETGLMVYLRQHGQELYAEDGSLGYDDDLVAEWFQRSLDLQASGGQPPASEALGLPTGQTFLATGKGAMEVTWSAQLGLIGDSAGSEMVLLRMPGESEFERTGMYFKPGMYLSIASTSGSSDAAAAFVDHFVNSPDVGRVVLSDLGIPASSTVREAIEPDLPPADRVASAFVAELQDEVVDAPPPMPVGAGEVAAIILRVNEEVLFGRTTAQEAATSFRSQVEGVISA